MKLLLTNPLTVKDIKENVIGRVLGGETGVAPAGSFTEKSETIEIETGAVKQIIDATIIDILDVDKFTEEQHDKLIALLYIRAMYGDMQPESVYEEIGEGEKSTKIPVFSMDDVNDFFRTNFCKQCKSEKEASSYTKEVLSDCNVDASIDLFKVTESFDRLNKDGVFTVDIISYNLCETDWNLLDKNAMLFNARNKVQNVVDTKLRPFNRALGKFGDQTVRTAAGAGAEIAGNVVSTSINAVTEAGKSFAYSFSRDIKVGDILTDERAKSIVPNLKEQGAKLGSLFNRERKQKRVGAR